MVPELDVEHRVGDVNKIGREVFHEVTEVDPDRTLTLMACGPGMNHWGYLDPTTAEYTRAVLPAKFAEQLRKLTRTSSDRGWDLPQGLTGRMRDTRRCEHADTAPRRSATLRYRTR